MACEHGRSPCGSLDSLLEIILRRIARQLLLIVVLVGASAGLVWLLYSLPEKLVDVKGLTPAERVSAVVDERRTMLAGLAALGAAAGLYYTHRRHQLDRDVSATSRYMQAVEQLSHEHVAVRLGGLYALERIAEDSPRDARTVQEVVSAHVRRGKSLWANGEEGDVATELTAAVRILGRSSRFSAPDLSGCDLHGLELGGLRLPGADLSGTSLRETVLSGCDLRGADLHGCDLTGAWLDADLRGANLNGTTLRDAMLDGGLLDHAVMQGADLHGFRVDTADLRGVDLRGAVIEDSAQLLAVAAAGGAVEVPSDLVKAHWSQIFGDIPRPSDDDFDDAPTHYFVNFEFLPRWAEHRHRRGQALMGVVAFDPNSESLSSEEFAARAAAMVRRAHGSTKEPGGGD